MTATLKHWHLLLGLTFALPIVILGITGSVLAAREHG